MTESNIIHFVPKAGRAAAKNVDDFIHAARYELTVFGKDLDWEQNFWDLSKFLQRSGKRSRQGFSFVSFDAAGTKKAIPMNQPYLDFAKAFMRYGYGISKKENHQQKMAAIRALEKILAEDSIDGKARVQDTNADKLNKASQLLKERNPGSAYQSGCHLEKLARFLNDHSMVAVRFKWVSPISKKPDVSIRVGEEFDERRKRLLPSTSSLRALPEIYSTSTEPVDVLVTSIVVLFLSAPDRYSEIYRLHIDCEHEDQNDFGEAVFGLRWFTSKGGDPAVNWITSEMVETCKEAIKRLRKLTDEARLMAKWYEDNPDRVYLPPELEKFRNQEFVTIKELCVLLGSTNVTSGYTWPEGANIEVHYIVNEKGKEVKAVKFADFEKAVIAKLPQGFPVMDPKSGLKYSDALLVYPRNMLTPNKFTYRCMFEALSIDQFNDQLGARIEYGFSSIFSRNGFTEPDGSPIRISSHKFRHFLITLALKKKLSYVVATLWRKSKDISQTKAYDHVSGEEVLGMLREANPGQMRGQIAELAVNPPMSREEYMEMMYPCVHTTQFGFCVHDWQLMPCQKHTACLECTEHVCIKGDRDKTERIWVELKDAEGQLERDVEAVRNGEIGSDQWVSKNKVKVERLRQLVSILDDESVLEGTIIQLTIPNEFTLIGQAVALRCQLDDDDAKILSGIRSKRVENTAQIANS